MSPPIDLSKILTPALYEDILAYQFPFEIPVDIAWASKFYFEGTPNNDKEVYDTTFHSALKPISLFNPSIPSLTQFLPPPSSPKYPENALALVLLIDQAPRQTFTGLNYRWTYMYFDVTARKLVKELLYTGNPAERPDSLSRWTKLGYPFEDAMIRKFWLLAPLIHSEDIEDHRAVSLKIEEMRKHVERYSGRRDPARDTMEQDSKDVLLFGNLIRGGPPSTFADFMFWMFRVFNAHDPIIEKFGRYPYLNGAQGRRTTVAEAVHLKDSDNFGMPSLTDDQVRKIREHVTLGTWEPLSDDGPYE
jgi:uncharacterized protein (DUF924 family)